MRMIRKISSDTKNSLNTVKINWKQNGNKLINIYIYIYIIKNIDCNSKEVLWVQCEEVTTHKNLDGNKGVKTKKRGK